MALTREPSGNRASTIGTDSSKRLPSGAIILSIIIRTWSLEINFFVVNSILPWRSTYTWSLLLTIISVISSSRKRSSRGPKAKASSQTSFTRRCRTSKEDKNAPVSSANKLVTIFSAFALNSLAFWGLVIISISSRLRSNSSINL